MGRLTGTKTLHPLIATASTPIARPVVVAVRMRRGKVADVRGAARFLPNADHRAGIGPHRPGRGAGRLSMGERGGIDLKAKTEAARTCH